MVRHHDSHPPPPVLPWRGWWISLNPCGVRSARPTDVSLGDNHVSVIATIIYRSDLDHWRSNHSHFKCYISQYKSDLSHRRSDHSHLKGYPSHYKGDLGHKQAGVSHWKKYTTKWPLGLWRTDHSHFCSGWDHFYSCCNYFFNGQGHFCSGWDNF